MLVWLEPTFTSCRPLWPCWSSGSGSTNKMLRPNFKKKLELPISIAMPSFVCSEIATSHNSFQLKDDPTNTSRVWQVNSCTILSLLLFLSWYAEVQKTHTQSLCKQIHIWNLNLILNYKEFFILSLWPLWDHTFLSISWPNGNNNCFDLKNIIT